MLKWINRLLIIFIALVFYFVSKTETEKSNISHIFRFDNRQEKLNINTLAVAGDFNEWRSNINYLKDTDGDSVWEARIYLEPGRYLYRYVQNGERWLRDPENNEYEGAYSNSVLNLRAAAEEISAKIIPETGSWLYKKPDSLRIILDRSASGTEIRFEFKIDGLSQKLNVYDGHISTSFPLLSEGEHQWKFRIIIEDTVEIGLKEGIWFINYDNQPPVADAGYTQFTHINQPVAFNGANSFDPDFDSLVKYKWSVVRAVGRYSLENSDTPFPVFVPMAAGRYLFRLIVSDSMKQTASDIGEIIVLPNELSKTKFTYQPDDSVSDLQGVSLVGEFNQWQNSVNPMRYDGKTKSWSTGIHLIPGQYEYKFVLDGQAWIPDPANSERIEDGWNGFNSLIRVASEKPNLIFSPAKMEEEKERISIPLNSGPATGEKIYWYEDFNNPESGIIVSRNRLQFDKSRKEGNYFYYAVTEKNGIYSDPATLLINHFGETIATDFSSSPAWADTAIIYEIYLRKYTESGTFESLKAQLPGLKSIGVNTVWLMPVYESPTDHGYAPTILFDTETDYGSIKEYRELIQYAHRLGMKVIFDFVANHLSDQHRFVRAAAMNSQSPLRGWFYWNPDGSWGYHNDWDTLVNLNYNNAQVRHFMLDVARFWAGLGVDGFRCDVAWAVPHDFWKDFRREIKKINPECLLIDEVLPRQQAYHFNEFDMSYDTDFYGNILDVMNKRKPVSALDYGLKKTETNYPQAAKSLRYIENHDLDRFLSKYGERRTKLMASLLFTVPGTPLIYYGQELGLRDMRPEYPGLKNSKWLDFYVSLINLRKKSSALSFGKMETLRLDDEKMIWRFRRYTTDDTVVADMNFSKNAQIVNIPENCSIIYPKDSSAEIFNKKLWLEPESIILYKKGDLQ
ncbi:MAG: alpha-amylase family glycosyl hydrolase [Calditrichaceae bacterium]